MATSAPPGLGVRRVSDDEIAHYQEKGWVHLPGLIPAALADDLLRTAKALMGEHGASYNDPGPRRDPTAFQTYEGFERDEPKAHALRRDPQLGENMALLLGRDGPVRSLAELLAVKIPRDLDTDQPGKGESVWHQDWNTPARCQSMAVWIALDEVTPEMGSMRFREGSQALGYLAPPVSSWPRAMALPLSPPLHLQQGDATVHNQLVVHGAPENTTDRARFAYIINYFPGDAPFLPWPNKHTDPIMDELQPGKPLDHPHFPLVYAP